MLIHLSREEVFVPGLQLCLPSCLISLSYHCTQLMPDSRLLMEEPPWFPRQCTRVICLVATGQEAVFVVVGVSFQGWRLCRWRGDADEV